MKRICIYTMLIVAIGVLAFCGKENDSNKETPEEIASIIDFEQSESFFNLDETNKISEESQLKKLAETTCLTVTRIDNENGDILPFVLELDYGDGTCNWPDGRMRKGKITMSITFALTGTKTSVLTFDEYYIDGYQLEGTISNIYGNVSENGNSLLKSFIQDGKLTFEDGTYIYNTAVKEIEKTEGGATLIITDDVYSTTGSATGYNRKEQKYTMTITSPVIRNSENLYAISGTKVYEVNGVEFTLDYGNGENDNLATISSDILDEDITVSLATGEVVEE